MNPLCFLDQNKGFLLAATGALYKTWDGGVSWLSVKENIFPTGYTPPSWTSAEYNTLQFLDTLNGYFSGKIGVLKTTDGGKSWTSVYPAGGQINVVKFFTPNTGYLKLDKAIYKTVDGGQSWTVSCKINSQILLTGMTFTDSTHGWVCGQRGAIYRLKLK